MYICDKCEFKIQQNFDYCPNCGAFFNNSECEIHQTKAIGICLVCDKICCSKCGEFVNQKFLCNEHSDIEMYQSMCNVYGSSDSVEIDYIISQLESSSCHPLRFDRKNSPISLGGSDYSLFRASGDTSGHLINEIKILIPLTEYQKALKIINELEINENKN